MKHFILGFATAVLVIVIGLFSFLGPNASQLLYLVGVSATASNPVDLTPEHLKKFTERPADTWSVDERQLRLDIPYRDEVRRHGPDYRGFAVMRLIPEMVFDAEDFEMVCISDISQDWVVYGVELWSEAQQALKEKYTRRLDILRPDSEFLPPHQTYYFGTETYRIGEFLMDDIELRAYEEKLSENPKGFDFTIGVDAKAVYGLQHAFKAITNRPISACDDTVDLSRFPEYQALMDQFWSTEGKLP